jgi:hypothetical protein
MEEIVNKVANSGLLTFNLEDHYDHTEKVSLDFKELLFQGLILKEKDFREYVKEQKWENFKDKNVSIFCSTDAVIPTWAFMLVANKLQPFAKEVFFCTPEELDNILFYRILDSIDLSEYKDQRVVIKGCSNLPVPVSAYVEITKRLTPIVKSIFYGEPCSTVPIYKKRPVK